MKKFSLKQYFTKFEISLWICSALFIIASFVIFDGKNYLTLIVSLIGASAILFCAKGNPFGQILMLVFCCIYGVISFGYAYYGELITYMCMSAPMAVISLVSWLKNPFDKGKAEVKVNSISKLELFLAFALCAAVTFCFYFILRAFNTANLLVSTVSVSTSFMAVYFSFRRSPYFAIGYAFNDLVLIALWILASIEDNSYISVVVCFIAFLANDSYCFINWLSIRKKQKIISKQNN